MTEDKPRSFDLKSWQGLTEVLKYARESNRTPEEYGAFRNLVLEYAQQKGTDPALKKKIDDLILTFHQARTEDEENEKDTKKHIGKKRDERVGRRVIPSFMPTFARVDSLVETPTPKSEVVPTPPSPPLPVEVPPLPPTPPAPAPEPVATSPVSHEPARQEHVLKSIEEHRNRIVEMKHRVNFLVGNPIALVDQGNTIGRDYMAALLNALKATSPGSTQNVEEAMDGLERTFNTILEYSARTRGGSASTADVAPPASPAYVQVPPPLAPVPVQEYTPVPPPPAPEPVYEPEPLPDLTPQPTPIRDEPVRRISVVQEQQQVPEQVKTYVPPPAPEPVYEPEPLRVSVQGSVSEIAPEPVFDRTPQPPMTKGTQEPAPVEFFAIPQSQSAYREEATAVEQRQLVDEAFASRTLGDISERGLEAESVSMGNENVAASLPEAYYQSGKGEQDARWSESGGDASLQDQIEELRHQLHENEVSESEHRSKIPSLIDLGNTLAGADLYANDTPHAYGASDEFSARELTKRPESSLTGITLGTPQVELMTPEVTMALTELLHEWNIFASSGLFGLGPGGIEHPLYVKLSGLPIGEVLAGRYEGVDIKTVHIIKDYVNAWRHEQGISYNPGETFEHYLRRVSQRILRRQQGLRD